MHVAWCSQLPPPDQAAMAMLGSAGQSPKPPAPATPDQGLSLPWKLAPAAVAAAPLVSASAGLIWTSAPAAAEPCCDLRLNAMAQGTTHLLRLVMASSTNQVLQGAHCILPLLLR